ncbi:MAG TPA: DinB family protein [Gemmatimonadaceae bacterium]|nr:DinB family protein [Gemmatimonadaceae bacterium]
MQVTDIRSLFAYNEWANARIFSAVALLDPGVLTEPRGSSFASIRDTLAHIATSEWIWLRRWRGESPKGPPEWGALKDAAGLAAKLREVESDRAAFLITLADADLRTPLAYRNLKGEDFHEPLEDQLAHVVNHSSYHRGQVATLSRQAGSPMPATDLIVFKREKG